MWDILKFLVFVLIFQMPPSGAERDLVWWKRTEWTPGEKLLVCGAAVLEVMRKAVLSEVIFTSPS